MCMNILISNIDGMNKHGRVYIVKISFSIIAIYEVGGIPFFILEPVLMKLVTRPVTWSSHALLQVHSHAVNETRGIE